MDMVVPNQPGCNRNTGSIGDLGAEIRLIYSVLEYIEYGACQTLRGFLNPFSIYRLFVRISRYPGKIAREIFLGDFPI